MLFPFTYLSHFHTLGVICSVSVFLTILKFFMRTGYISDLYVYIVPVI